MTTTHDFKDGRGEVPAHKHPNGGGWVADSASVSAEAYVGPNAHVFGNARVYGDAHVFGNARVSHTPITIAGGEYHITITDQHVAIGCTYEPLEWWVNTPAPEECSILESMRDAIIAIALAHHARCSGAEGSDE